MGGARTTDHARVGPCAQRADAARLSTIQAFPTCWLSTSSERVAYAGWQFILAFNIGVLYGFGPSIDMTIARDRSWGILLGDVVVTIIFLTLWPVSTAGVVRQAAARALDGLADLLLARPGAAATCP